MESPLETALNCWYKARALLGMNQASQAQPLMERADSLFQEALRQDDGNVDAHRQYASFLVARKRYGEAALHYERAMSLDPIDVTIREDYDRLQAVRATVPPDPALAEDPEKIKRLLALARMYIEDCQLDDAEETLAEVLQIAPNHPQALREYVGLLMGQGRYHQAKSYLQTLLEADRPSFEMCFADQPDAPPEFQWLRGDLYQATGDLDAAEPLVRAALEANPSDIGRIQGYVELLLGLGRKPEATDYLCDAVKRLPNEAALHREYARLLADQGLCDEVGRQLRQAEKLDPTDAATIALRLALQPRLDIYRAASGQMALARECAAEGNIAEAHKYFQEALRIDPDHLPALKAYAAFLQGQKKHAEALGLWVMVQVREPETAGRQIEEIVACQSDNSQGLKALAHSLILRNRASEAETYLRRALELAPEDPETLRLLADLLVELQRPNEVDDLLASHAKAVQTDPLLAVRYAERLRARGEYDQARRSYRQARKLAPDDDAVIGAIEAAQLEMVAAAEAEGEMALGDESAAVGDFSEAESRYQRALAIAPKHVATFLRYASLLEDQGKPDQASEQMVRLASFNQAEADAHYRTRLAQLAAIPAGRAAYADFLQHTGRPDAARSELRALLDAQPADLHTLDDYLALLDQTGHLAEAELRLTAALAQDDESPMLHLRYGQQLLRRHNYRQARQQLNRARELTAVGRPGDELQQCIAATLAGAASEFAQFDQAQPELALARESVSKDPEEAETAFQKALIACPDHVQALVHYGRFLVTQGRGDEAESYLVLAVELDPLDIGATQALAELRPIQEGASDANGH
jgi:tetratricopeptide (TPR) repeat protein